MLQYASVSMCVHFCHFLPHIWFTDSKVGREKGKKLGTKNYFAKEPKDAGERKKKHNLLGIKRCFKNLKRVIFLPELSEFQIQTFKKNLGFDLIWKNCESLKVCTFNSFHYKVQPLQVSHGWVMFNSRQVIFWLAVIDAKTPLSQWNVKSFTPLFLLQVRYLVRPSESVY